MMDAGSASVLFFAQPLVAAFLQAMMLGEKLQWYFYIGAGVTAAGR